MKISLYSCTFSLLFLIIACNKSREIPVITPEDLVAGELALTELADEVSYIKLDNSVLLSDIKDVKRVEEGYLIRNNDGLFLFRTNGKFRNQIGKKGKGPGEYAYVDDFTVNPATGEIFLINLKKVFVYNFAGELLSSFETPDSLNFKNVVFFENRLFFPKGFGFSGLKNEWYATDLKGHVTNQKQNFVEVGELRVDYLIHPIFNDGKSLFYWNQLNDTIFCIDEKCKPAYLFAKDKFRVTENDLASEENYRNKSSWQMLSVQGTKKYLFFDYILIKDRLRVYTMFDKNKNLMYKIASSILGAETINLNDFDNGPAFVPVSTYHSDSEEFLLGWINSFQLKMLVESTEFKNSTPKFPEKKKELEQLANNLDENDNPVLMLVKLKE
ncbi:6-bladed beta-propeller [Maribellus maritimus]|uniref:6-bladed beta-propeller n=1 Tax=Maribellus maritimus TaxID=2870838 RepID=UPI001EEB215D|nr:6-bladed beta-propeller [Maribellus maritimus]MCG6189356.1 6-bladed beta-propeller [Maribellus maritimus]